MMAMWTLGIRRGDEVITTPFTAIPTYSAIRHVGAVPVFVDIDPETYLMDLSKVSAAITKRTKLIVPVHLFGSVVDVPKLRTIVGSGIKILEDCAQAHRRMVRRCEDAAPMAMAACSSPMTPNSRGSPNRTACTG